MKHHTLFDHIVTHSILFLSALLFTWLTVIIPTPLNPSLALVTSAGLGAGLIFLLHLFAKAYRLVGTLTTFLPLLFFTIAAVKLHLVSHTQLWQTWACAISGAVITRLLYHTLNKRKHKSHHYS
jgi:hypothetical protein